MNNFIYKIIINKKMANFNNILNKILLNNTLLLLLSIITIVLIFSDTSLDLQSLYNILLIIGLLLIEKSFIIDIEDKFNEVSGIIDGGSFDPDEEKIIIVGEKEKDIVIGKFLGLSITLSALIIQLIVLFVK